MSLLHIRRERRALGVRTKRPPSPLRLIVLLVLVAAAIWYLGRIT